MLSPTAKPESRRRRRLIFTEHDILPTTGLESKKYSKPYQEEEHQSAALDAGTKDSVGCDTAFFQCLGSIPCTDCFLALQSFDIDWAGVTADTSCATVLDALHGNQQKQFCASLTSPTDNDAKIFCDTFHSCVYFDDDDDKKDAATKDTVDCDKLTECDWKGMRPSLLGDGVCHNSFQGGCYNHKICGYDHGDCCPDTCSTPKDSYLECGSDGYMCKDPKSTHCDPTATLHCPADANGGEDDTAVRPDCTSNQSLYKLQMFDTFGDGWEGTTITIRPGAGATQGQQLNPVFEGALKSGAEGTEYICLSLDPSCYQVETSGGAWGREVSWTISGAKAGSPTVASGGGAIQCDFPVSGGTCTNTCQGKNNKDPSVDPEYKDFKDMYHCIDEKCAIQSEHCHEDPACIKCVEDDIPDSCYSINSFTAVTDCTICKCSGLKDNAFCEKKSFPDDGVVPDAKKDSAPAKPCSPHETSEGGAAVIKFSQCMKDFDETSMLLTDFDQNHFGGLDDFEACAHSYNNRPDHGDKKALDCVQILVDTMVPVDNAPNKAVAKLAKLLYNDGETFCNCAKTASDDAPLCPSFYNFKTLLYESLDACRALDEIDCDAWGLFHEGCSSKFTAKFGSLDVTSRDHCAYLEGGCDGVGPFPSFRRLDCASEVSVEAWDFYDKYASYCLGNGVVQPTAATPTTRAPAPSQPTKHPTTNNAVNPSLIKPTAYVPAFDDDDDDNVRPSYSPPDEKKSHWFRNLFLLALFGGIGFVIYKRRADGFNFVRYRRVSMFGGGGGGYAGGGDADMYSGFALEGSTTFEPPSLPPTPMSMPNSGFGGGYGAPGGYVG